MESTLSVPVTKKEDAWTVLSLLDWASPYLGGKNIDSPRLTAELLLAHALGCDRLRLYLNHDQPLTRDELQGFKSLLKRRLAHEPVQYITGTANFMGLELMVNNGVLIPRPETEQLVEKGLEALDGMETRPRSVLDVGTGSGCIALALAHFKKDVLVDAIDISDDALAVAKENVNRHALSSRIQLFREDVRALPEYRFEKRYDLLVSNPPYVSRVEQQTLPPEIRLHEPVIATSDDGDGLTYHRTIASTGKNIVRSGGVICLEVGYGQSGQVKEIVGAAGFYDVTIWNDYAGIGRIVTAVNG